jgi:hypothetical protein
MIELSDFILCINLIQKYRARQPYKMGPPYFGYRTYASVGGWPSLQEHGTPGAHRVDENKHSHGQKSYSGENVKSVAHLPTKLEDSSED